MLLTTQPQDLVLDLEWRPVQVMMRGAGTIRDPSFATLSVSVQQPVSTLTKDPHRWATSPSLDNDTVNQQQPTTNSQIRPQSGTRGPPVDRRERFQRPTQRASFSSTPGVTHIPAEYTWRRIVGGSGLWVDTGTDAVAFVEQAKRAGVKLAAGPGFSPPRRLPHDAATTPVARRSRTETRIGRRLRRIEATGGNAVTTGRGAGENSRSSQELWGWNCNIVTACYSSLQFR